jgi:hypothetical protein
MWLMIEWPDGESKPTKFVLTTLPRRMSKKQIVRLPPRPDGKVTPIRSRSRPERHFVDSFITIRLALARAIARWLPRYPLCQRENADPEHVHRGDALAHVRSHLSQ